MFGSLTRSAAMLRSPTWIGPFPKVDAVVKAARAAVVRAQSASTQSRSNGEWMSIRFAHYATLCRCDHPNITVRSLQPFSMYKSSRCPATHRPMATYNFKESPYDVLGITRNATQKDIKMAYFREAKKWHPDLNPNNPNAKAQFQNVTSAYEFLSNEQNRQEFDRTGKTSTSQQYGRADTYQSATHAEDIFRKVQEDVDIIMSAFKTYQQDLTDELAFAARSAAQGNWAAVWSVAKANSGLLLGVVIPTLLLLRFPAAVPVVLRGLFATSQFILVALIRSNNLSLAVSLLWRQIVRLSLEQKRRNKTKDRI